MFKDLQQFIEFNSILGKRSFIGNEPLQLRNMTFDFVDAALRLLQPAFGAIPLHAEEQ